MGFHPELDEYKGFTFSNTNCAQPTSKNEKKVEITEIRHEHQSKYPLPGNIYIPYVAFFRVPEWCLIPRDRLRRQNMSALLIFFQKN